MERTFRLRPAHRRLLVGVAAFVLPFAPLALAAWASTGLLPVTISTPERVHQVLLPAAEAPKVADALAAAGVAWTPADVLLPPPTATVRPGDVITLHRIERRRLDREVDIPARAIRIPDPRLARGAEVVLEEGRAGRSRVSLEIVRVDGRPYAENLVASDLLVEARPRRVLVGTGARPDRKTMVLEATAYTPGPESCGPSADGVTALGLKAGYGVVAVDPSRIPLGTRLYIEGYGLAVAGDVGGEIRGDRIDLGFDDIETARLFGRRKVKVHIL